MKFMPYKSSKIELLQNQLQQKCSEAKETKD